MAHRSEVSSPTNSDPATTAEQAEEDTPSGPIGCEGGWWLQQGDNLRSAWFIMPLGYGCPPVKSVRMAQAISISIFSR